MPAISNGEAREEGLDRKSHLDHFHRIGRTHEVFAVVADEPLALGFRGSDLAIGAKRPQGAAQLMTLHVERRGHGALRAELFPRRHASNGQDDRLEVRRVGLEARRRRHGPAGTG